MRDVMTVPTGSICSVHKTDNPYIVHAARFRGVVDRKLIILETEIGIVVVTPGGYMTALDREGRELGFIEPDPPLPTTTPDLE